ncbi:MAG: Na/Pi symporter [bacterium]
MNKEAFRLIIKILLVAFFLYLFLVSISLMSVAFKGFGREFAEGLLVSTSNPFVALFIGILATSIVQSSSTITSIVVGMVASGILSISNAIPIIMGANIGTTVTNLLVSFGHIVRREEFKKAIAGAAVHDFFNIICVAIMFPLQLTTGFLEKLATVLSGLFVNCGGIKFTSPLKIITQPAVNIIKHFFVDFLNLSGKAGYICVLAVSVLFLFGSLYYIVKLMRSLIIQRSETILGNIIGKQGIIGIFIGFIFTALVQSSSITTSLLIPLIGAGVLTIEVAFPITMGANVGTTTTAILASFATGNPAAITIAFVHFLFNMIGVCLLYPFKIFRQIPIALAKKLGELAYIKRRYAVIFVLSVFFIIPALLIFIYRLF